MSGTKFWEANEKFLARREYGAQNPVKTEGNALMNIRVLALALLEVDIEDILPDDSRQTFAVGLMYGNSLIVANKGVKNGLKYVSTIRKKIGESIGGSVPATYTESVEAGLHAEMAIVQNLIASEQNPKGAVWMLGNVLQIICVGKPVCPDCAGWLNKHRIPHLSLIRNGENVEVHYQCGKPSQGGQWKHPRTGAFYQSDTPKGTPTLNTYQKGGSSYNRPLGS